MLPRAAATGLLALALLAAAGCSRAAYEEPPPPAGQRRVTVEVGGMVNAVCVARVRHHLAFVPGVRHVEVNLVRGRAEVVCDAGVADSALAAAVRHAGPDYVGRVVD